MQQGFTLSTKKGNENQLEIEFFVHKRITTAVKTAQFDSDRISHSALRG
jgi:hypothetical protein